MAALLPLFALPTLTCAIHAADAAVVDYHKHFVGVLMTDSPATAPSFHPPVVDEDPGEQKTTTGNNIFATLRVTDRSVMWRYMFEEVDQVVKVGVLKGRDGCVAWCCSELWCAELHFTAIRKGEYGSRKDRIHLRPANWTHCTQGQALN